MENNYVKYEILRDSNDCSIVNSIAQPHSMYAICFQNGSLEPRQVTYGGTFKSNNLLIFRIHNLYIKVLHETIL